MIYMFPSGAALEKIYSDPITLDNGLPTLDWTTGSAVLGVSNDNTITLGICSEPQSSTGQDRGGRAFTLKPACQASSACPPAPPSHRGRLSAKP